MWEGREEGRDTLEEAEPNRAAQPSAAPRPSAPTCHLVSQKPRVQREALRPHCHLLTLQLSWMTRDQDLQHGAPRTGGREMHPIALNEQDSNRSEGRKQQKPEPCSLSGPRLRAGGETPEPQTR